MEVKVDGVNGRLYWGATGFEGMDHRTARWISFDGKDEWIISPIDVRELMLSRAPPQRLARIILAPTSRAVLVEFPTTEARQSFADFIVTQKRHFAQPSQTPADASPQSAVPKPEMKAEAPESSARETPQYLQRYAELRQLYAVLVDSGVITEEEFAAAQRDAENEFTVSLEAQRLGATSVSQVIETLVDPETHSIRPLTEPLMADLFRQIPLFASIYRARVRTAADEFVFWDAVLRKVLFLASSDEPGTMPEAHDTPPPPLRGGEIEANERPVAPTRPKRRRSPEGGRAESVIHQWNTAGASVAQGHPAQGPLPEGVVPLPDLLEALPTALPSVRSHPPFFTPLTSTPRTSDPGLGAARQRMAELPSMWTAAFSLPSRPPQIQLLAGPGLVTAAIRPLPHLTSDERTIVALLQQFWVSSNSLRRSQMLDRLRKLDAEGLAKTEAVRVALKRALSTASPRNGY